MNAARKQTQALDALLAGYAAGSLPGPMQVLVEAHLELASENRSFVRALETAAGCELEQIEPCAVGHRADCLDKIFATAPDCRREPALRSIVPASRPGRFPAALERYMGRRLKDIPWTTRLPWLREWIFREEDGCSARLYWLKAKGTIPRHTHQGTEALLVCRGGFSDHIERYDAGDIALADADVNHVPRADEDEDCLCYAVFEGTPRLTGSFTRFFQPFVR